MTELDRMVAVGRVTPTSVRLWARLPFPGTLELRLLGGAGDRRVRWRPRMHEGGDNTVAFTYPDEFAGESPLPPSTACSFTLHVDGELVGQGRFETAPATPEQAPDRWTLAFMSCHQPFGSDGEPTSATLNMLEAVATTLDEHDVKLVLFIGDQIYADLPTELSLFTARKNGEPALLSCTPEQIRALYQRQYRRAWNLPALQRCHAHRPTLCVPDDHEIVNDWGSLREHVDPRWQKVRDGALEACWDYQGSRSFLRQERPRLRFDQSLVWGNAGMFVLDVRSERHPEEMGGTIVTEAQMAELDAFLERSGHLDAAFVVVPVPPVHIPDWLTAVGAPLLEGEISDRWSHQSYARTRDRLLKRIAHHARTHPSQRVAILSGDIHAGWAIGLHDQRDGDAGRPLFWQFVSSAVTNPESSLVGGLAKALLKVTTPLIGSIDDLRIGPIRSGDDGNGKNPFGGLNIGLVEVIREPPGCRVRFKLVSHDEKQPGRPVVTFDSGPL